MKTDNILKLIRYLTRIPKSIYVNFRVYPFKEVIIGNDAPIRAKILILECSIIKDGYIIGANSTITKSFSEENSIIAGNPARILRTGI